MWILDPNSDDGYRRRVAVHEAGHAIALCLHYGPPTHLELTMAGDHHGIMKPAPPMADLQHEARNHEEMARYKPAIAVYVAGALAVAVIDPALYRNPDDGALEEFAGEVGSDLDYFKARVTLARPAVGGDEPFSGAPAPEDLFQAVVSETGAVLERYRGAVLHIAQALLENPVLQGDQLRAVLAGAGLGDRAG